ncbi:MAG: hypothetical protein K8R91_02980, partial [Phycisphaerae bacterium]|nr:hypothetical protein [Phycisphaerae bacterium]
MTEYLDTDALEQLATMFSSAAGSPVQILSPDGELLAGKSDHKGKPTEAKVFVSGGHAGTISLDGRGDSSESARLVDLMRDVVVRLHEQAGQIRNRVEELAAVYRMTAVFTERRD